VKIAATQNGSRGILGGFSKGISIVFLQLEGGSGTAGVGQIGTKSGWRVLAERKERTRLGLSKFTAEAAEQAAEHRDKLGIAGKVKDVADVHKTLWPNQPESNQILNLGILIGNSRPTLPERIESE